MQEMATKNAHFMVDQKSPDVPVKGASVCLKEPSDIDDKDLPHRLSLQTRRSDGLICMPPLIIAHVADIIDLEMWRIIWEYNMFVDRIKPGKHREKSKKFTETLLSMAMVHRSWTAYAQRALRRHVKLHSYSQIEDYLQRDLAGPWVKGLSFVGDSDIYFREPNHWQLLSTVLSKATHLTHLSVKSSFHHMDAEEEYSEDVFSVDDNNQMFQEAISSICHLSNLSSLIFLTDETGVGPCQSPAVVCQIFSHLPNLEYLQLYLWNYEYDDDEREEPSLSDPSIVKGPVPSLRKVVLAIEGDECSPWACLSWLVNSTAQLKPEWLNINISDLKTSIELPRTLRNIVSNSDEMPSIQRLELCAGNLDRNNLSYLTFFANIISRCINVKVLSTYDGGGEILAILPRSLESLYLAVIKNDLPYLDQFDISISSLLESERLPNLHKICISPFGSGRLASGSMQRLTQTCIKKGIGFDLPQAPLAIAP